MSTEKRTVRTSKGPREYTYLGCPLTRNRSAWCFRLCRPDTEGRGRCGRIAPHGLRGRTQEGIARHKRQRLESHCEKLEQMYLVGPDTIALDPGVRVMEGAAEIVIPAEQLWRHSDGSLRCTMCHKVMNDSARLAVNSIVPDRLVLTEAFTMRITNPVADGPLLARGRFVNLSGDFYVAESVVTDAEGTEVGRATGTFRVSDVALSAEAGYG